MEPTPADLARESEQARFGVSPPAGAADELARKGASFEDLVGEAMKYIDDPEVSDTAIARMFIDRGYSEEVAYWIAREAAVRRAPGSGEGGPSGQTILV